MSAQLQMDFNPRLFWARFAEEAHGLANELAAVERGQNTSIDPVERLNQLLHSYDLSLNADVCLQDANCRVLKLVGPNEASIAGLLSSAPSIHGWRFTSDMRSSIAAHA